MKKYIKIALLLFQFVLLVFFSNCKKEIDKQIPNTSFGRVYPIAGNQTISGTIKTPDDGFLIWGNSEIDGKNIKDGFLMRLDKDYNQIWYKTYGGFSNDYFKSAVFDTQGNILAAGTSTSFGVSIDTNSTQINPLIYAVYVNGNGDLLWQKTYKGNPSGVNKYNDLSNVLLLPNQNFALVGTTSNYGNRTALIQCINNQGTSMWYGYYYDNFPAVGFDAVNATVNKDGNIVLMILQSAATNTVTVMKVNHNSSSGNNKFISKSTLNLGFFFDYYDFVTPLKVIDENQEKYLLASDSGMLVYNPSGTIFTYKNIIKGGEIHDAAFNNGNAFFASPYNFIKTDIEGKILWESSPYNSQNIERVGGIFFDKDEQISLFCSYWNTYKEKDLAILKFNQYGQLNIK